MDNSDQQTEYTKEAEMSAESIEMFLAAIEKIGISDTRETDIPDTDKTPVRYVRNAPHFFDASNPSKTVRVKLVNGASVYVRQKNIVGRCTSTFHIGFLTEPLMIEHHCLEKNCPSFLKIETGSYWVQKKEKAQRKEEHKMEKHQRIKKETEKEKLARQNKERLQNIADSTGTNIHVIRAVKPRYWKMYINYVSDNDYADESLYTDFLHSVREEYPGLIIELKHIKNIDGSYVTTEEYLKKKK